MQGRSKNIKVRPWGLGKCSAGMWVCTSSMREKPARSAWGRSRRAWNPSKGPWQRAVLRVFICGWADCTLPRVTSQGYRWGRIHLPTLLQAANPPPVWETLPSNLHKCTQDTVNLVTSLSLYLAHWPQAHCGVTFSIQEVEVLFLKPWSH